MLIALQLRHEVLLLLQHLVKFIATTWPTSIDPVYLDYAL